MRRYSLFPVSCPLFTVILLLSLLLPTAGAYAQYAGDASCCRQNEDQTPSRKIFTELTLGIGSENALSTYLSPVSYSGLHFSLHGTWHKRMPFDPRRWEMRFDGEVEGAAMLNPAGNARMIDFGALFAWGMERVWNPSPQLSVAAGGNIATDAGLLYLPRNGNNPVAARASLGLRPVAAISYSLKIGRLPVTISDRASFPLLGCFFSQQFGETYYEIYLGNHSGLVHFAWPGNRYGVDNRLSADLHFGKRALTLGYGFRMDGSYVCNLETRRFIHSFLIGIKF